MKLLIVGASARAAAMSARRAGFCVVAGDLFADADLHAVAESATPIDYPHAIPDFVAATDSDAWLYTGAVENHPELIARAAAARPLLGNSAAVVQRLRDPFRLAASFAARGLRVPRVARDAASLAADLPWLRKPWRSAGGAQIAAWSRDSTGGELAATAGSSTEVAPVVAASVPAWYFQERIAGRPFSASFLAAGGEAVFVGAAWQFVGAGWTGAAGFRYGGSIEWRAPSAVVAQCRRLGQAAAEEFGLVGLFGVDAVLDSRDSDPVMWPIEVNPRYTASMELFDRQSAPAAGRADSDGEREPDSLIGQHVIACLAGRLPRDAAARPHDLSGKAILYATEPMQMSPAAFAWLCARNAHRGRPTIADLPRVGTTLQAGWPIVTLLADGPDETAVEASLRALAERVRRQFGGARSPA